MSDIKILIGADIKELEQKLAVAKAKLASLGQEGPRSLAPLQQRLSGLEFPTQKVDKFKDAFKNLATGLIGPTAAMAGIGLAVAGAVKWLEIVAKDFITVGKSAEESGKKIKEYNDLVNSTAASVAKEATEVIGLLSVLNNETETRERKLATIKKLQDIQPEIFKNLKLEKDAVVGLDDAYKAYLENLTNIIAAKIIQAQIEAQVTELIKLQGIANTKEDQSTIDRLKNLINTNGQLKEIKKNLQDTKLGGGFLTDKQTTQRIKEVEGSIKSLFEKLTEFSNAIKVKKIKIKPETIQIEKPDKIEIERIPDFFYEQANPLSRATGSTLTPEIVIKPSVTVDPGANNAIDMAYRSLLGKEAIERLERISAEFSAMVSNTIEDVAESSLISLGDAIGDALAGKKDVIPNLFGSLMNNVGQQVQELGKFLIKSAITVKIAKEAFQKLLANPVAAVAVGIGLIALGALLKQQASKQFQGFASGTTGVNQGGIYDVGERGPERIFLPAGSKVQPNNELNAFGGGNQVFIPAVTLSGPDLVIAFQRASQQMNRNN